MAKILLVEDEKDTRDLVRAILEMDGHDVIEALTAEEGVALAHEQSPSVILMDVSLAGAHDGLWATRLLRSESAFDRTPIIALTAHAMIGDRVRVLAAGCDDHWTKPITDILAFKEIIARVVTDGRGCEASSSRSRRGVRRTSSNLFSAGMMTLVTLIAALCLAGVLRYGFSDPSASLM